MSNTHRAEALNCATRIANTLLMQDEAGNWSEGDTIAKKILHTADLFAEWLGPDPVRSGGGGNFPKREKVKYDAKCPDCGGDMEDVRATRKSDGAPIARCWNRGAWNGEQKRFANCNGARWERKEETG